MFASKDTLLTRPSGGYTIARSVRLRSSASAYFSRTPSSTGNRRTYTHSFWAKRGILGALRWVFSARESTTSGNYFYEALFYSDDTFSVQLRDGSSNEVGNIRTTQVFRDPSAWYHFVVVIDTTQATSSNRMKLYVNGSQVTALGTATYPSQNFDTGANTSGYPFYIGNYVTTSPSSLYNYDGYQTEINFIDGQALTPSSFGETDSITGVWKPKAYSGTYGTNGFELNFSDNSNNTAATIGKDYSGNGNNWTPNNISVTAGVTYDSMQDVPTLTSITAANYAVLNPLATSGTSITLSNGNLYATYAAAGWATAESTMAMNASGKYYFEFTKTDTSSQMVGIMPFTGSTTSFVGNDANGYGYFSANGYLYNNAGSSTTFGSTFTNGDVIGIAFDASTGKLWFSKNNTWQASGDPSAGTSPAATASTAYTYVAGFSTNGSGVGTVNFGQRPFTYTPPTGYVALNTYNLPASTITNGAAYMAATLWTGDSVSPKSFSNAVNGVSFQPDFVWIKNRSNAYYHNLYDSVRGSGSSKDLNSNTTNSEATNASDAALYGYLSAFNSNGFQTTNGTDGSGPSIWVNQSGQTFVGWQWKAGGTSASNTNGSITSTVSVGATQGFSVVTYTSTTGTVGHGLGVAPSMIIMKPRNNTDQWTVGHAFTNNGSSPWNYGLALNATSAQDANSGFWNNTAPTSTVFSQGSWNSGFTKVAYCFAPVAGYSAFGSYTGNGSTDGPFIYMGFRPRWLLTKRTDSTSDWTIIDTSVNTYNVASFYQTANKANAQETYAGWDVLSNGIKFRNTDAGINGSGATYIYAAFAENPFKNSLAR